MSLKRKEKLSFEKQQNSISHGENNSILFIGNLFNLKSVVYKRILNKNRTMDLIYLYTVCGR